MQLTLPVTGIVGTRVSEDATAVALVLSTDAADNIIVGIPLEVLDAMIGAMVAASAEAKAMGAPKTDQVFVRPIHTWSTWAARLEAPGMVGLAFDRSLPKRVGFILPHGVARDIAKSLRKSAQDSVCAVAAPSTKQ